MTMRPKEEVGSDFSFFELDIEAPGGCGTSLGKLGMRAGDRKEAVWEI
ncbi:MAG: hypothetical protein K8H90_06185 [Thermoanaerobaculia bacterium]|nr:hypothetical protein [Thermoanaerobaculia bacterium]